MIVAITVSLAIALAVLLVIVIILYKRRRQARKSSGPVHAFINTADLQDARQRPLPQPSPPVNQVCAS